MPTTDPKKILFSTLQLGHGPFATKGSWVKMWNLVLEKYAHTYNTEILIMIKKDCVFKIVYINNNKNNNIDNSM